MLSVSDIGVCFDIAVDCVVKFFKLVVSETANLRAVVLAQERICSVVRLCATVCLVLMRILTLVLAVVPNQIFVEQHH